MKILDVVQGSSAWKVARLGLPTASNFDRLVTPKTRKPAAAAATYANELLAEWALGCPLEDVDSGFMQRGRGMEQEAIAWYERHDTDGFALRTVQRVGLCLSDDGLVGCSPDGLVGDDGGLEVKCPSAAVHVANMLDRDAFRMKHYGQAQGCLMVTGRKWWDLLSFNPFLPPVLERIYPDAEYLAQLRFALDALHATLRDGKARLTALGVTPRAPQAEAPIASMSAIPF